MRAKSWVGSILAGAVAGAAGTLSMDAYWRCVIRCGLGSPRAGLRKNEEPTTVKVARTALEKAGVENPSPEVRRLGGKVVHWTYGISWGVAAALSQRLGCPVESFGGLPFGTALWLFGDLWLLYELGYARHPRDYPLRLHAQALGAHLAYGCGLWGVLQAWAQLRETEARRNQTLQRAA